MRYRSIQGFLTWTVPFLLLLGCRTLPPIPEPRVLLPPDGALYLYMPVPVNRDLLERALTSLPASSGGPAPSQSREKDRGVTYVLDHTREFYLTLLSGKGAGAIPAPRWVLLGVGEYSSFLFRAALNPDEGWEQKQIRRSGFTLVYYQQNTSGLQVALLHNRYLLVSNGEMVPALELFMNPPSRATPSPHPFPPSGAGNAPSDGLPPLALSVYGTSSALDLLPSPLSPLLGPLEKAGVFESFSVILTRPDPQYYEASGSILFPREEQVRPASVLFRLALAGWVLQQKGQPPSSVKIAMEGRAIRYSGIPLSVEMVEQFLQSMYR